jgi:hypothetical protein
LENIYGWKNIIIFSENDVIKTSFSLKLFIESGMRMAEIACWALANMLKIVGLEKVEGELAKMIYDNICFPFYPVIYRTFSFLSRLRSFDKKPVLSSNIDLFVVL